MQSRIELAELGARRDQETQARDRLHGAVEEGRERIARRREEVRSAHERAAELLRSADEAQLELDAQIRLEEERRLHQSGLRERYESSTSSVESLEVEVRAATARARGAARAAGLERDVGARRAHAPRAARRLDPRALRGRPHRARAGRGAGCRGPCAELPGTPEEREAELERVRQALRSLGEVHLGAIEEYEEVSERARYLDEQKTDLELSIERLRGAIARINRTSRERFRETFEAVDKVFQTVFPKMFEGGRAHLALTGDEDILEAGIEIIAQPPGKKLQNVNLLSGGEKSLTAMALLVAVFTVKPSPFFLLDEVDAALDDANANRFNTLLREMSKTSQFLMITHNKQSIEIADALFGVTMQEQGLSKLVTVDLVAVGRARAAPSEAASAEGRAQRGAAERSRLD